MSEVGTVWIHILSRKIKKNPNLSEFFYPSYVLDYRVVVLKYWVLFTDGESIFKSQ